jgi:hypothetical protein
MLARYLPLSILCASSVACGEVAVSDDASASGAGASDAATAARCTPTDPAACRYTSDLSFSVGVADNLVLHDLARADLPVPLLIHYPLGASGRRPVVIWSHGGSPSAGGKNRSEEWGLNLAAAGYVVIHPSRVPVDDVAPFQAECTLEGFPAPEDCALFVANVKFGPQTAVFVLDSLPAIEAMVPDLAGHLDAARVVMAGHSAGSPVPLTLAGAVRVFNSGAHRDGDPRPVAFLATGPHGPDYASFEDGFREDSFHEIDSRPFLWISGRGDETGAVGADNHEPSEARTAGWLTSTRGNKLLSWDNDEVAVHESMDIHKCDQTPVQRAHCDAFAMLGVAFLDAFVRQRSAAAAYLASSAYDTLNAGVIELHRR